MTKTRPPGNPNAPRRSYSAGRVAPGPPRADPLPYSNTAERERRRRELQARGLTSDDGSYGPDFDDEDEDPAQEVQPAPTRRLSLKEEISRPNYDPKAYPHDGPPKRPVPEAEKTTIKDEVSELTRQQNLVKSVPDTLVSLQSVASVLVGTLQRDEAFVRNLCNTIADEEREKQDREAVPPLPTVAPKRWADRPDKSNKNPAPFIQDVYGKWFGRGFHEGTLRDIDNALFKAWEKWMREGAKDAPPGFKVPTASEWEQQNRLPPEIMKRAMAQLKRDQRERDRTRGR